ncbi:MAG: Lrp/AsnC family transcriptional regulator [Candidatus Aenigmarchaeota archaeon]|nr:Lrp/AsnC family transcriptional regulator [Candidatus Aenigmarchaeota archaeon]
MVIDEKDRKILRELLRDSRQSFRRIARKVGLTTSTVVKRYKNLKKEGIIKKSTVLVDAEKIGYPLTATIEIRISKGKLSEVEKHISKKYNVIAVYDVTGEFDALIIARFRNRKELNSFVKSLLSTEYIERTNTHFVLNTIKEDFSILI